MELEDGGAGGAELRGGFGEFGFRALVGSGHGGAVTGAEERRDHARARESHDQHALARWIESQSQLYASAHIQVRRQDLCCGHETCTSAPRAAVTCLHLCRS